METIVKITWNKPEEKDWLCDENISIALHSYCKNTKFKVTDLKEMTASESIFGFCAWLTGSAILIFSSHNQSFSSGLFQVIFTIVSIFLLS